MKIPQNIVIGGINYETKIVPKEHANLNNKYVGCINCQDQTITLDGCLGKDAMNVSLLHECVHGMMENLGMTEHDEVLVDGLAHQLHMLIQNNHEMFKDE